MIEQHFSKKGFQVWVLCALFFLYEFFLRTVMGTYQHPVTHDLHLTALQFSLMSSTVFMIVYGAMQIPAGLIVDNIGLKRSLLIGAMICVLATVCFSHVHDFMTALECRIIMGFGASFGFICLLMAVYDWMPKRHRALFIGLSQFVGTLGPMLAAGPMASLVEAEHIGWRTLFNSLSVIGLVLGLLVYCFVENNQQKAKRLIILKRPQRPSRVLKNLFLRWQPWYIAVISAILYFIVEYFSENEGLHFLMLKGFSYSTASYMITAAWIGYAVGCPLLGFFSDKLECRKRIMQVCVIVQIIAVSMMVFGMQYVDILLGLILLGLSAGGQSIGFSAMSEQFSQQYVAVGFGLNNAMITVVSAINAPLIGWSLDTLGQRRILTIMDYQHVFVGFIALSILAFLVCFFLLKETYGKSAVDFTILHP